MKRILSVAAALALFGTFHAGAVQAQTPPSVAVAGGIGATERAELPSRAVTRYNVKLVFALETGNYVADVRVRVTDQAGTTRVDGIARGPWVYANLAPGAYTATVTYAGHTLTQALAVKDDARHVAHFTWPESVERTAAARLGVEPILGTLRENPQL